MNKYEILYIIDASVTDEDKEKVISSVSDLVKANGGNASEPEKWGVRKFAYPINYKNEGYYVLYQFESTAEVAQDIVSLMRIDENVLRQMCLRK